MGAPKIQLDKELGSTPKMEVSSYRSLDFDEIDGAHESHEEGEGNWLISYADLMTLLVGFFVVLQSFSKIDDQSFEMVKKEATKLFGGQYQIPFEELKSSLEKVVAESKLKNQVLMQATALGVTITFQGALFFDQGSYELKGEALDIVHKLIPVISDKAGGVSIIVEGHTDNTPLNGKGAILSNWELSSVRACRVLHIFEKAGFARERIKAQGWGDTRPVVANQDANGRPIELNQAQNRRVVIKILKNQDGIDG